MEQLALFDWGGGLVNFHKYEICRDGKKVEAVWCNGSFVYEWGVLERDQIDSYQHIEGIERWDNQIIKTTGI